MMQLIVWVLLLNSVVFLSHSYTIEIQEPEKLSNSSGSSTNEDHVGEGIIFILVNLFSLSMLLVCQANLCIFAATNLKNVT